MIGRCVGGHWPPLRLGNVQMVDKRCAEVAWAANDRPYGITVADEFTCGAPGSYPRAPSLALRAIHLAVPYGKIG